MNHLTLYAYEELLAARPNPAIDRRDGAASLPLDLEHPGAFGSSDALFGSVLAHLKLQLNVAAFEPPKSLHDLVNVTVAAPDEHGGYRFVVLSQREVGAPGQQRDDEVVEADVLGFGQLREVGVEPSSQPDVRDSAVVNHLRHGTACSTTCLGAAV